MPKLSVILPARNAEDTVQRAVSSTLRYLPRDAELLVLDDGSTDATAERARAAGNDPRLRVETCDTPGGIATALNWLLKNTDSEYIARMDADDACLPGRFQLGTRALDMGDDIVFSQVIEFSQRKITPAAPIGIPPEAFPLHLLVTNPASHPAMMAKRETVEAVGGYREVPAEDYDLWIRAALHGARLRRLASWGLLYRLHEKQITASSQWRHASWRNQDQAQVFGELSKQLTGHTLERLVATALKPVAVRHQELDQFEMAIKPQIQRLGFPHRQFLERKLAQRLRWARQYEDYDNKENHQDTPEGQQ